MRRLSVPLLSVLVHAACGCAGVAAAQAPPGEEEIAPSERLATETGDEELDPFEWFVLPLAGYDSDRGGGGAVLALMFWNEPEVAPYRDKLFAVVSLTHELVQTHSVRWERVGLFGAPWRLEMGLTFDATPIDNFCGFGNQADCSRSAAEAAVRARGLDPQSEAGREVVRDYFEVRYMRLRADVRLTYEGFDLEGLRLLTSWRGIQSWSGFFGADGPYPGSLYAEVFPDGEEGFQSELELAAVLERRDHERRPTEGYVLSASLRGAHRFIGSHWDYGGGTLGAATYVPFDRGHRLVLASRTVVDLLGGDPPSYVLGSVGGFWPSAAFGGSSMGRGVRQRRYIGRIKLVGQSELRWAVIGDPERFQFTMQGFVDAGWVALGWDRVGGDPKKILTGFGGGIGGAWGRNFVLRFDVAVSPHEGYSPFFYVLLSHPY